MAHGFRTLQQWDHWLSHSFLGDSVIQEESEHVQHLLKNHFGKHAVLIGVPYQSSLLDQTNIPCHTVMCPPVTPHSLKKWVESDLHELPMASGSVDLVLLPHTLEFVDNPRQLLAEACRIVKPEGLIVVSGFNPYSLWGYRKWLARQHRLPWEGNMITAHKIKAWLRLADFALEDQEYALYRPPIRYQAAYKKLHLIEKIGRLCLPTLGGVYLLMARAKVIPLTPIKMKWKQQLSGIRIPTTITGHIARHFK